MNGAESLLTTARTAGIDLCLANPGTTEMPLVNALDGVPEIRPVLGLFEGVVTGAADGYYRDRYGVHCSILERQLNRSGLHAGRKFREIRLNGQRRVSLRQRSARGIDAQPHCSVRSKRCRAEV